MEAKHSILYTDGRFTEKTPYTFEVTLHRWQTMVSFSRIIDYVLRVRYVDEECVHLDKEVLLVRTDGEAIRLAVEKFHEMQQWKDDNRVEERGG